MYKYYKLVGRDIVPTYSAYEAFDNTSYNRRIALTLSKDKSVYISTVFLGIDHSFDGGDPVLFETMVFGGNHDGDMERYTTYSDAEAGHARMVAKVLGDDAMESK